MELRYKRKMKMPLYNLPGFATGTPNNNEGATGAMVGGGGLGNNYGNIATSAVAHAGDIYESFSPVKGQNEIIADSGYSNAQGYGFGYQRMNDVNRAAQFKELSRQNTSNQLKTTASGAALGAAIGTAIGPVGSLIGGAIGAVGGFVTGLFGRKHRKRKLARQLYEAQQSVNRYNNFAQSSAQSDYLEQGYNNDHEYTDDDYLYANHGKDQGINKLPRYNNGKDVYTSVGKQNVQPNARVAAGESILDNLEDLDNATGHVVKDGKLNKDTNLANLSNNTVVLGNDVDWRTGRTFRDSALPYTMALEKINKKYETRTNQKLNDLRGTIGKRSDEVQQREVNKLKKPIVEKLKDIKDQQDMQHKLTGYTLNRVGLPGAAYGADQIGNAISSTLGLAGSIYQMIQSKGDIHRPDIYAANPYENAALNKLAQLRINPYPIARNIYDSDRRNRYAINRTGGLTGAQKYLATVAAGLGTQDNIAETYLKAQEQNNQYRGQYASALMQAGQSNAQRRQSANQYNEEYIASAHAAKQQARQQAMQNGLAQIQQYFANQYKYDQFNKMMDLYQQDINLRKPQNNYYHTPTMQDIQMNNTYSPSGGMASYSMPNINSLRYNNTNLNFGGYTPPVLSQVRYNR